MFACGCGPSRGDRLVVATNWPASACAEIDRDARSGPDKLAIEWIRVPPGESPSQVLDHGMDVDVILGGTPGSFRNLVDRGLLAPLDGPVAPRWVVLRRVPFVLMVRSGEGTEILDSMDDPSHADRLALTDPRNDPDQWAVGLLTHADDWRSAYASLVMAAALARPMGRDPNEAIREVADGEAHVAVVAKDRVPDDPSLQGLRWEGGGEAIEGAAVVAGSRRETTARRWLQALPGFTPHLTGAKEASPAEDLVGDLLGAVLVESQDELRSARRVVAAERYPKAAVELLTEAPPWPPASISRMKAKADGPALLEVLARQVAPDPAARVWLLSAWNRDPKNLDGVLLEELARAAGGKLVAERRFRDWLRTEWTALARQRYRRVAIRASAGDLPP